MQRVIEYYYTHVSPWAYLGHRAFLDLADRHGYAIRFKPVLLGPVFAESGGLPLSKRHPLRQAYRLVELQRWREKRGLPLNLRPRHFPADPSLADRIALALALEGGPAGAFTEAAFRLTWVDDRDISDRPVLAAVLETLGLDTDKVLTAADGRDIEDRYVSHQSDALAAGVFGSPSYVLNGEVFWGQDRLDLLEDALTSGRQPYRPD